MLFYVLAPEPMEAPGTPPRSVTFWTEPTTAAERSELLESFLPYHHFGSSRDVSRGHFIIVEPD